MQGKNIKCADGFSHGFKVEIYRNISLRLALKWNDSIKEEKQQ